MSSTDCSIKPVSSILGELRSKSKASHSAHHSRFFAFCSQFCPGLAANELHISAAAALLRRLHLVSTAQQQPLREIYSRLLRAACRVVP